MLNEALKSLAQQTMMPAEVILVNDGPLTDLQEKMIHYHECQLPIRRCGNDSNQGLASALNLGLKHCSYKYVVRMDADDMCAPNRIERQLEFMYANPEIDIAGSFAREVNRNGELGATRRVPLEHAAIISMLWTCPLLHPTVIFRKQLIESLGGYDNSLRRRQDYELWFRCARHGATFANIPQVLLYYRFDWSMLRKQTPRLAFQQGRVGYRGASALGLAYWKRVACFAPFLRSMLPGRFEHWAYQLMRRFGPRS
ncbi:glycosyltransferase [Marinobacter sp. ATCH36]|nr:glycosyltransferase [Marinobacter sp. ATCH36]